MHLLYRVCRSLAKGVFRLLYSLTRYGSERYVQGGAIIAANHSSYLDPPIIAVSWPDEIAFLAREGLFRVPILGWMMRRLNAHPLVPGSHNLASIKLACELLHKGNKVVIFPEGRRASDGELAPVKAGVGLLASRAQCPIIPCYIHGAYEVWPRQKCVPRLQGNLTCVFGSPIYWTDFEELSRKEAQIAVGERLQESLEALRNWTLDGCKGYPP